MATIYVRETRGGKKRYQALVRRKGHPTLRQTFPNKTLAKNWAKTIEARILSGRFLPRIDAEKHTLGTGSWAVQTHCERPLPHRTREHGKRRRHPHTPLLFPIEAGVVSERDDPLARVGGAQV